MSERWSQVVALFHGARALEPEERAGWLAEMTDDDALRQEVLELCRADGASHPVLDAAAARLAALATEVGGPLAPGARVGPFEVIDVLAAGASGTVHRARQEQPARTVALKVLDAGLGDPERLRRFEHEAELLARLDHPHVAHVYQAGTMERGGRRVPWIAMELVEGARTLTGFAREQDLDLRARVELVLDTCAAVQHGHRKGVVHRDLKPDNLLVGSDGQLKVIDFGVAKSTDGDALVTRAGELIGTLAYMSPEQASGREVDTASDVYALGVVLHELLTGRRPHDLEGLDLVEAARRIATEPADPALCAGLPVDLRWVVGRALAPDPGARYGSVGALAEDLRRWTEGQPVLARPPSAAYHLSRWARRNPALVMMTLSLVLALLVGSGLAVWGMLQARRGQADAEWGQRYLSELLLEGDPYVTGENLLFSEAVLRSLEHLDREPPPAGIERDLRWRLGSLVRHLGRPREAVRELELAHQLATRELGPDHRTTLEVGVELGRLQAKLERFDEAEALLHDTRERSLRLAGGEDRLSLSAADAVNQLLLQRDEVRAALERHREVLALRIELLGHDDEDTQSSRNNLATALQRLNRYEEARVLHQEVLVARQRSLGDDNPRTVIARGNLAASLQNLGERQGAEEHLRAGLGSAERVLPQYHDVTSNLRNNLGVLLRTTGRRGEARGLFELALEGRRRRLGLDHEKTLTTLANLIALHVAVATDPESEGEHASLATSEAERLFGEYTRNEHVLADRNEPQLASLRANYARLLLSQGRKEEALAMATEAVRLAPQVWTEDAWQVGVVRSGRADVLLALGRTAEAAEEYEASLQLLDHLPEDNTYRSRVEVSLAGLGR